jgi:hypothetical protein
MKIRVSREAKLVSRYLNPPNSDFCRLEIHASILEIQTSFKHIQVARRILFKLVSGSGF